MRFKTVKTLLIAVSAAAAAATCSGDDPLAPHLAPPPTSASHSLSGGGQGSPIHVVPLQRTAPLATNESSSATIGVFGGHLTLPNAGLTIVVPPFALAAPMTLTVTARAGSNVSYDFAPHGTTFRLPLVAIQDLRSTQASTGGLIDPSSLFVGYFPDAGDVTSVTELLNVAVSPLNQLSAVAIWHFSGYTWSSGREGVPEPGVPTPP